MNRVIHTYSFLLNDLLFFDHSPFHITSLAFIFACLLIAICLLDYFLPLCMVLAMSLLPSTGVLPHRRLPWYFVFVRYSQSTYDARFILNRFRNNSHIFTTVLDFRVSSPKYICWLVAEVSRNGFLTTIILPSILYALLMLLLPSPERCWWNCHFRWTFFGNTYTQRNGVWCVIRYYCTVARTVRTYDASLPIWKQLTDLFANNGRDILCYILLTCYSLLAVLSSELHEKNMKTEKRGKNSREFLFIFQFSWNSKLTSCKLLNFATFRCTIVSCRVV